MLVTPLRAGGGDHEGRAGAARALRRAARTSLAHRLHLSTAATDEATLVRDVARHTGRPIEQVAGLLADTSPPPHSDDDLITLATDLAALEREVRRT